MHVGVFVNSGYGQSLDVIVFVFFGVFVVHVSRFLGGFEV